MPFAVRLILPMLVGLLLGAATRPAVPDPLTARDHHDLRCATAFAVVAAAQAHGDATALALPPLGIRGKRYFGLVGERIAAQTGLSGEAMRDLLAQTAHRVAREGANAIAHSCLGELDAAVPPRPAPDALACLAILGVYADVLSARDPDSELAVTLRGESAALGGAAHALLGARGIAAAGEVDAIARERARVGEALNGGPVSVDADDFSQCRRLAASIGG